MSKHELLEFLTHVNAADAAEIAKAFDVPHPAAAMAALRLVRQGLAERHVDPDRGTYWYRISAHGRARLTYLRHSD